MRFLGLFDGLPQEFAFDYRLDPIGFDFVVEALLQVVLVALLQHFQIALQPQQPLLCVVLPAALVLVEVELLSGRCAGSSCVLGGAGGGVVVAYEGLEGVVHG
jgi:hypothetical protein